jgi:signal transduction histidine kinase
MSVASERDMSYPRREPHPLPAYPLAGAARPPKPPLTKRMRPGHWIAVDCVVAAVAALIDVLIAAHGSGSAPGGGPGPVGGPVPGGGVPVAVGLLIGACVFVPIALRRRAPVTAFGALIVLAVITADGAIASAALIFLAAAYALYTVTVTSNRQTGFAALLLALTVMVLIVALDHRVRLNGGAGVFLPVALALVLAWITGYSVRQRRLYAQTLQQQATSSAVAEERLRIARELHDIVAHSMSVIAVQAGYGQYVIDTSPAGARDALGAIQATSRDALEEMRRMLGVLRQQDAAPAGVAGVPGSVPGPGLGAAAGLGPGAGPGPGSGPIPPAGAARPAASAMSAPLAPAPGLASLDRLIQRTRGAGVEVSLQRSGPVRALPAGVDLSAYRIIQEALTNVVKHAGGGARCVISLDYGEDAVDIWVTDDGGHPLAAAPAASAAAAAAANPRAPGVPGVPGVPGLPVGGTGHGIIGMRERANLCGGDFSAGALPDGGFEVTATLPLLGGPAFDGVIP